VNKTGYENETLTVADAFYLGNAPVLSNPSVTPSSGNWWETYDFLLRIEDADQTNNTVTLWVSKDNITWTEVAVQSLMVPIPRFTAAYFPNFQDVTFSSSDKGTRYFKFTTIDEPSNFTAESAVGDFVIDGNLSITINRPNGTVNSDTFNVSFGEIVNWSAYELDSNGTNLTMGAVPSYEAVLSGLSDGTHNITVYANDSGGNMNSTGRNWTRDTNAPDITSVSNSTIYPIRAYISWNTTESANATIYLGTNASLLYENATNASLLSFRNLSVQYLAKNTTYHYNVTSCDAAGNCNTTGPLNFTTPDCTQELGSCAWSACTGGTETETCNDVNMCTYPWTGIVSDTRDCDDGGGSHHGSSGGGVAAPPANVSSRPELVPGIGIINNTKLQEAIENVLDKGNLSESAKNNLLRLSESITAQTSATRNMTYSGGKTRLQTKLRYAGTKRARNFMVYEKLPKVFASRASDVTIICPGASVSVVEEDPAWLITYPDVEPGEEMLITYETAGAKASTVPNLTQTEIYAETLFEAPPAAQGNLTVNCTPGARHCSGAP
jgi:hypothetical protein